MKKDFLVIILLLTFSLPAVRSLFAPGGYTSHDLTHHVIRQISMDRLLKEGQFPPRWSGELNYGYGYPVFLFNYPLPAMFGEVFHLLGFGYVDAVKAVFFSSMIFSVLGMYLFLNSLLSIRMPAFLGAMFYLYAPIRFLNVYVSAAVGASLALGILPFVFWGITELSKRERKSFKASLIGAISFAGLILTHNVTALIFAPVLIVFALIVARKQLFKVGLMFLFGLGLSAWFWLPALIESKDLLFKIFFKDFYKDHFITVWQLLRSPWGYGLSNPQHPGPGDMSYQLGIIHILAIIIFSIWYLISGRRKVRALGLFILISFVISIFLMLKISQPVWESLPFLSMVQFPLRFSAIAVFVSSIAVALLIKYPLFIPLSVNMDSRLRGNDGIRWFVFIVLLILVLYANRNHWKINEVFNPSEDYYLQAKGTSSSHGEHLPVWGRTMGKESASKLEIIKGDGEIKLLKSSSTHILAEFEATDSAVLRLNQFYFPGWEIKVDNQKTKFDYLVEGKDHGLPVFKIGAGVHQIEARFKNTPVRNLADSISIASLGLVVVYLLYAGYRPRSS